MTTTYRIDILDSSGNKLYEVTEFESFELSKKVNSVDTFEFVVHDKSKFIDQLQEDFIIELWRKNKKLMPEWAREFVGFYKYYKFEYRERGYFTARSIGLNVLLESRINAWYAGTAGRTIFNNQPAETVMKELVRWNLTGDATVENGRITNGEITGLEIEPDAGQGNNISISCAWASVLDILQKIAIDGGGDFNITKDGDIFTFRFYVGQLGTDRRNELLFSLERGNIANPEFTLNRINEKTTAIVAGKGTGNSRVIGIVKKTGVQPIEIFVDARDVDDTEILRDRGTVALKRNSYTSGLKFAIIQSPTSYYGIDYFLGDIAKISFARFTGDVKIIGITIRIGKDGRETIGVDVEIL